VLKPRSRAVGRILAVAGSRVGDATAKLHPP
jgi:hypothetical protein